MSGPRLFCAFLLFSLCVSELPAQGVFLSGYSGGIGYSRFRGGRGLSVGVNFFGARAGFVGPGFAGPGFIGSGFVGPGFVGPGFCGPGFVGPGFWGPGFCGPFDPWCSPFGIQRNFVSIVTVPPPIVVVPRPLFFDPLGDPDFRLDVPGRLALPQVAPLPAMPAIPAMPAPPPMNPAPAPLPPKKDPPAVKKDDAERELPQRPEPLDDPDAEYARLMILGKEAFAQQQYGRAAQRFRQGIALRGRKSEGYILLTQALLAQGKYHEANDAIRAGLIRDPRHPLADFRPIELYRDSPAAYAEHLEVLEEAVERHPMDAELSFVYAYVLWFDGRREQAGRWFARAAQADFLFSASEEFLKQLRSSEEL